MPFAPPRYVLTEVNGATATLAEPLIYRGRDDTFTIPAGFVTDFASVPRFLTWLVPTMGAYTRAAVVHDWLCTELERRQLFGRRYQVPAPARDTDGIFRRICREEGVPVLRRWLLWCGVRWGALANPARRAGWSHDAAAVIAISLLAFPFVALPALLTGVVVLIDNVVERIR